MIRMTVLKKDGTPREIFEFEFIQTKQKYISKWISHFISEAIIFAENNDSKVIIEKAKGD